jgi:hypothetical protein
VELEKPELAGVVVGVLEVGVGVLEGERFVVVIPKLGLLTLEFEALVIAVLELGGCC